MVAVFYLLAVYGLATSIAVLKAGKLIRHPLEALKDLFKGRFLGMPWRFLAALVNCPPCLSFWIGLAASRWVLSPSYEAVLGRGGNIWTAAVLDGLAACGTSWVLHTVTMRMCAGIEDVLHVEKVREI